MDFPRLLSFLLGLLVLGGCAGGQNTTVSYDSDADRTTYETRTYTVSSISGSNYASSKSITVRAIADCQGADCTPEEASLVFTAGGNEQLSLSGVNGRIVADDTEIEWSNADANADFVHRTDDRILQVVGEFATVALSLDQLRQIATASSVDGSIGGQPLNLDSGMQSGLQNLLQKVRPNDSGQGGQ